MEKRAWVWEERVWVWEERKKVDERLWWWWKRSEQDRWLYSTPQCSIVHRITAKYTTLQHAGEWWDRPSISPFVRLPVYLSVCLSVDKSVYLTVCESISQTFPLNLYLPLTLTYRNSLYCGSSQVRTPTVRGIGRLPLRTNANIGSV